MSIGAYSLQRCLGSQLVLVTVEMLSEIVYFHDAAAWYMVTGVEGGTKHQHQATSNLYVKTYFITMVGTVQ